MAAAAVVSSTSHYQPAEKNRAPIHQPKLLASSPYLDAGHLLDLTTLDLQSQIFAIALTTLRTKTPKYATVRYEESLDLDRLLDEVKRLSSASDIRWKRQDFYVVEFRSQLKPQIDNPLLFKLDKESHREANTSGGLLKYWYGEPDGDRKNLATCFWTTREAAIAGGRGPMHKEARAVIGVMYESINVKGLRFTIDDDVRGWNLEPFH